MTNICFKFYMSQFDFTTQYKNAGPSNKHYSFIIVTGFIWTISNCFVISDNCFFKICQYKLFEIAEKRASFKRRQDNKGVHENNSSNI